jgi:cold shock CspA family protein
MLLLCLKLNSVCEVNDCTWRDALSNTPMTEIDAQISDEHAWQVNGVDSFDYNGNEAEFDCEGDEDDEDYYDADEEDDDDYDGEYAGEVVYWDEEKGYGFITDPDGDRIFFHVSGLSVKDDQDYLRGYDDSGVTSFDPEVRFRYEWHESRQEYKAVDVHWLSY